MPLNLTSKARVTWCPGCPNGQILVAYRQAINALVEAKEIKLENLVSVAGIGCHGKITDYLQTNTFTSLHGRLLPSMTGIKLANPALTVVGMTGDGDSLSEGIEHLVHAAKRNSDVKIFLHDNQVFALTTGQATALSPKGFKGKSTPFGSVEEPFNPLLLMLSVGATFVARSFALDIAKTKEIMMAVIKHKGFAFVDIIQPCITFDDTREVYKQNTYWIDADFPFYDKSAAIAKVSENNNGKVPLGIFYKADLPTFEDSILA